MRRARIALWCALGLGQAWIDYEVWNRIEWQRADLSDCNRNITRLFARLR